MNTRRQMEQMDIDEPWPKNLRNHEYVYDITDVSVDTERRLVEVQSAGQTLPASIIESDLFYVRHVWVDTIPSVVWRTLIGEERARMIGFGRESLTAILEVDY